MHATLKEIIRNLKRHRGTAPWYEPERRPAQGEVRGLQWQAPDGRKLLFMLDTAGNILVSREMPAAEATDTPPIVLAANQLQAMRDHYQWLAGPATD